jgi:hypothetical protein
VHVVNRRRLRRWLRRQPPILDEAPVTRSSSTRGGRRRGPGRTPGLRQAWGPCGRRRVDDPAAANGDIFFRCDTHRLNLAVSRAPALAVVVLSPQLLDAPVRSPEQLRQVNALCRLVEMATDSRTVLTRR